MLAFRLLPLVLVAVLPACASIVGGTKQPITVDTAPVTEAGCSLSNDKGTFTVESTPGSAVVGRSIEDLVVTCRKEGYRSSPVRIPSTTKALAFGNILAGGLVGAAVDRGTGAAFDYSAMIHVTMFPVSLPVTPDAPTVPAATSPNNVGHTGPTSPVETVPGDQALVDDRRPALDRLRDLRTQRERNRISEEEFERRRKIILQEE
jgi:hypothetical protein